MAVSGQKAPATYPNTSGLLLGPNPETVPPGALRQGLNASIRKQGIIQHRRPIALITPFGLPGYPPQGGVEGMFAYQDKLHFVCRETGGNDLYYFNNPGYLNTDVTSIPASTPAFDGGAMQLFRPPATAEMNGACYIARPFAGTGQSRCWWKIDQLGAAPYLAGIPAAYDFSGVTAGFTVGAWLPAKASVAYRIVYGRIDANGFAVTGPPSGRFVYTNSTLLAQNPNLTAGRAPGLDTNYFYQVYRTAFNKEGGDPGDEMSLVYQQYFTGTDDPPQFTDIYDDKMIKGPNLYTNENEEGIAQANYPPPMAQHIAGFKQAMFYANTIGNQFLEVQMLGAPLDTVIDSIQANTPLPGQTTFNFATFLPGIPDNTYKLSVANTASNNGTFSIISATLTPTISIVVQSTGVDQVGSGGVAMFARVTNGTTSYHATYDGGTGGGTWNAFTVPLNLADGSPAGPAFRVATGAQTLATSIQQNPLETTFNATYVSGPQDAPGRLRFESRSVGTPFTLQALPATAGSTSQGYGQRWAQTLGVTRSSTPQVFPSRVYFSKPNQPEAVPLGNSIDILGSQTGGSQPILGLIPLRDSLFVLTKNGVFRITGDGETWTVQRYDDTIRPVCPLDAEGRLQSQPSAVVNNKLYVVATKGVVEITDIGSRVISNAVDSLLRGFVEGTSASPTILEPWTTLMTNERDGLLTVGIINQIATWAETDNRAISLTYNSRLAGVIGGPIAAYPGQGTGPWTQNSLASDSTQESLSLCVGLEVAGISYRMPSSGDTILPSGNIYQELVCDYTNSPASFNEVQAGSPLPGDRVIVDLLSIDPENSQVTIAWPRAIPTVSRAPAVGMLLQENSTGLPNKLAGGLYQVFEVQDLLTETGHIYTLTLTPFLPGTAGFAFAFNTGFAYAWTSEQCSLTVEYVPFTAGNDRSSKHWDDVGVLLAVESSVISPTVGIYTEQDQGITTQAGPDSVVYDIRAVVDGTHQRSQRISVIFTDTSVGRHTFIRGVTYTFSEDALGRTL